MINNAFLLQIKLPIRGAYICFTILMHHPQRNLKLSARPTSTRTEQPNLPRPCLSCSSSKTIHFPSMTHFSVSINAQTFPYNYKLYYQVCLRTNEFVCRRVTWFWLKVYDMPREIIHLWGSQWTCMCNPFNTLFFCWRNTLVILKTKMTTTRWAL